MKIHLKINKILKSYMDLLILKFPTEICKLIDKYLYYEKEVIDKSYKKWWNLHHKNIVIFQMMYSPYYCQCYYYLSLYDYNNSPCWFCNDNGHPMKICAKYYQDVFLLRKKLNFS